MVIIARDASLAAGHLVIPDRYHLIIMFQTASIFLLVKNLNSSKIFHKSSKLLKEGLIGGLTVSLSKYSYGIYLIHILFLRIFLLSDLDFIHRNPIKWIPFLIIAILILSWATLAILNRIPLLNKITGVH